MRLDGYSLDAAHPADGAETPCTPPGRYKVEIQTSRRSYGSTIIEIGDKDRFEPFKTVVHNFSNTIALRIENLEYQATLEERVRRQTEALEISRAFLESIFEYTGDAISVLDREFQVVRANDTVRELKSELGEGYSETEPLIARRSVFFDADKNAADCPVRNAFETGTVHTAIAPFPSERDPQRWFAISAFPITDSSGTVINVIESGRDITALKRLQDDLSRTVEEKDLLLREVHHRVKNNLNMVISVLNLQFAPFDDERVDEALIASVERIQSMALVHQFLYQSDSRRTINLQTFLERLIDELSGNYVAGSSAQIRAEIPEIHIGADVAIPLSIIVNELVTNALKYAFSDGFAGTIDIGCRKPDTDTMVLTVADDGIGLPDGFNINSCTSLGMRLVHGLSEQINGRVEISPRFPGDSRPGTTCSIRIPVV